MRNQQVLSASFANLSKKSALLDAVENGNHDAKKHLQEWLYDNSDLRISPKIIAVDEIGDTIHDDAIDTLKNSMTARIVDTVDLLLVVPEDLRNERWQESPVIWEMLSFEDNILEQKNTPLPDALRDAIEEVRDRVSECGIDPDDLIEDLDSVIHQTAARRALIIETTRIALDANLSHLNVLDATSVKHTITADLFIDPESLDAAVCDACEQQEMLDQIKIRGAQPSFSVESSELTRVTGEEPLQSRIGDVYLVRSKNVEALGDHYILIVGGPIPKPHGIRPQEIVYAISLNANTPLDDYSRDEDLVLLKLNDDATQRFHDTHNVEDEYRYTNEN